MGTGVVDLWSANYNCFVAIKESTGGMPNFDRGMDTWLISKEKSTVTCYFNGRPPSQLIGVSMSTYCYRKVM